MRERAVAVLQYSTQNLLLRALSPEAFAIVSPHLEFVSLKIRDVIEVAGERSDFAYFGETAMVSTVAPSGIEIGDQVEIGVCGREGVAGVGLLLKSEIAAFDSFIQIAGDAHRIDADRLQEVISGSPEMTQLFLRYAYSHQIQIAHTAMANARFTLLERMSRWILMCHDRSNGDQINLTHEFLSIMLGVRRAGVTTDMHVLEGEHAVINKRGRVFVRERSVLEHYAGSCYGAAEAEYERLVGQKLRRTSSTSSR